jgi:hypothetical protein
MRRKMSRERSSSCARLIEVVPIGTSTDKMRSKKPLPRPTMCRDRAKLQVPRVAKANGLVGAMGGPYKVGDGETLHASKPACERRNAIG